jgi:hypothetical protein
VAAQDGRNDVSGLDSVAEGSGLGCDARGAGVAVRDFDVLSNRRTYRAHPF